MALSPIQLGAFAWWRCDQNVVLDGSNLVQRWQDVIGGLYLGQSNFSGRPGITNGRYTTTAINFDISGVYNRGLYLCNSSLVALGPGTFNFLHNGTTDYHVFICCRYTGIIHSTTQLRTLLSTRISSTGATIGQDNSASLKRGQARLYNGPTLICDASSATNGWDATVSPGSLFEIKFHNDGGPGTDLFLDVNGTDIASATLGAPSAGNSGVGLTVGCIDYGGVSNYSYAWNGYIEDIVVFNNKYLSGSDLTNLRDYFMNLRGVPHGLTLGQGNVTTSFSPVGQDKIVHNVSKNVGFGFATSATYKRAIDFLNNHIDTSFSPYGKLTEKFVLSGHSITGTSVSGSVRQIIKTSGHSNTDFSVHTKDELKITLSGTGSTTSIVSGALRTDVIIENAGLGLKFKALGLIAKNYYLTENTDFSFEPFGDCSGIHIISGIDAHLSMPFYLPVLHPKWKFLGFTGDVDTRFKMYGFLDKKVLEGDAYFSFAMNGHLTSLMQETASLSAGFNINAELSKLALLDGNAYFDFKVNEKITYIMLFSSDASFNFSVNGIANVVNGLISGNVDFGFDSSGSIFSYAVAEILAMQHGVVKRIPVFATDVTKLTDGSEINKNLHYHKPGFSANDVFRIDNSIEFFRVGTPVALFNESGRTIAYPASAKFDDYSQYKVHESVGLSLTYNTFNGPPIEIAISGELPVSDFVWDVIPTQDDVGSSVYLSIIPGKLSLTKPLDFGQWIQKIGILTNGNSSMIKVLIRIEKSEQIVF